MLGFPILHLKGMRILMFQLSGFYYILPKPKPEIKAFINRGRRLAEGHLGRTRACWRCSIGIRAFRV